MSKAYKTKRDRKLQFTAVIAIAAAICFCAGEGLAQREFSRGYSRLETTAEILTRLQQFPSDGGLLIKLKDSLAKEDDPALRQQGMAVIAAAMLLREEPEVAARAIEALRKSYPDSLYTRALTVANIGATCPNCEGSGKVWRTCPVCSGSGRCQMCNGSGHFELRLVQGERTVCPKCGGSGQCSECAGSGRTHRDCHKCRGTGMLIDKERVKAVYRAVLAGRPEDSIVGQTLAAPTGQTGQEAEEDALRYF
jgi:hypothetical protein